MHCKIAVYKNLCTHLWPAIFALHSLPLTCLQKGWTKVCSELHGGNGNDKSSILDVCIPACHVLWCGVSAWMAIAPENLCSEILWESTPMPIEQHSTFSKPAHATFDPYATTIFATSEWVEQALASIWLSLFLSVLSFLQCKNFQLVIAVVVTASLFPPLAIIALMWPLVVSSALYTTVKIFTKFWGTNSQMKNCHGNSSVHASRVLKRASVSHWSLLWNQTMPLKKMFLHDTTSQFCCLLCKKLWDRAKY